MKLLLVGFSAQNAAMLNALINMNDVQKVVEVALSFDDNLRLCLPTIFDEHQDAQLMIINLGGVGMPNPSIAQQERLLAFIDGRMALLTTQSAVKAEQLSDLLASPTVLFVQSPYTKTVMTQEIDRAIKLAQALPTTRPKAVTATPQKDSELSATNAPTEQQVPTRTVVYDKSEWLHALLVTHFADNVALSHRFADILTARMPVKMLIGTQVVYANRLTHTALVSDWAALMRDCQNGAHSTESIKVIPIDTNDFEEVEHSNIKKYPLSICLWQMATRLLPKSIGFSNHQLLLKVRLLPSIDKEQEMPSELQTLTSVCLLKPKTCTQLSGRLDCDKVAANRLFLLAILSGVADDEVLSHAFYDTTPSITPQSDVPKTPKTGLLAKLGF